MPKKLNFLLQKLSDRSHITDEIRPRPAEWGYMGDGLG